LEDKQIDEKSDQNDTRKNRPQVSCVQTVSPIFDRAKLIDRIITENGRAIKLVVTVEKRGQVIPTHIVLIDKINPKNEPIQNSVEDLTGKN
jgi:hypothetical protein